MVVLKYHTSSSEERLKKEQGQNHEISWRLFLIILARHNGGLDDIGDSKIESSSVYVLDWDLMHETYMWIC